MPSILGVIGALCVVMAYTLLQFKKLRYETYSYNLLNFIGALLLTISLFYNFNLGSFLIEIVWLSVSLYGIYTVWKSKNDSRKNEIRLNVGEKE